MELPANWDEKSHRLWIEGQKQEAIRSLSEVIKKGPSESERQLKKQEAFYLGYSGEWKKAVSVLEEVCLAYADDMEALFNLGICYSKSGNQMKAVEKLEEVLKRNPRFFMAWDGLAEAYTNLRRFAEAKEAGGRSLVLKDEAAKIAVGTVLDFLAKHAEIDEVRLVCFGGESAEAHRHALSPR